MQQKKEPKKEEDKQKIIIQVKEELEKQDARNISIKEGIYASIAQGSAHSYISPFAIALGATNAQIGILASLPSLASPLSQLFGARLMEKYPRKKIVVKFVFLEALMWLSLLIISLLYFKGIAFQFPLMLIIFYTMLISIGALATPSWFSWMGDIIPEKIRGRYFSKRNKICGTTALVTMLIASFFLDYFKTKGLVFIEFSILFFIASMSRLVSTYFFSKQYEPEIKLEKGYYFSLWSFLKKIFTNNFGKFVVFVSLIHLATFIAGPFFNVYMLKDLQFSYLTFTIVAISASLASLISFPLW